MHTLVYIRRSKDFNNSVMDYAVSHLKSESIVTVSEYFNGDLRIDMNHTEHDYSFRAQQYVIKNLDINSIILRDRLLRNSSHFLALKLIRRAVAQILDIFEKNTFDALVTYPVDNYIMDILVQVARTNRIPCFGVCNFFLSAYKRQTVYGEHNPQRDVTMNEAEVVLHELQNEFRSHMAPSRGRALRAAIKRYLRYKLRYPLFYLMGCLVFRRNEYDLMVTPHITTVRGLLNFFVERHFTPVKKVDFSKSSILVPLHYFPEATIEYWSGSLYQVEFEDMLRCEIDQLLERYDQVILKEHPAAVFDNASSFYRKLLSDGRVVFVDPFVSTNSLLDKVDVLGCWTGTAGIEALVNGKKVELFTSESYYRRALHAHPDIIEVHGKAISIRSPVLLVQEILKGCFFIEK